MNIEFTKDVRYIHKFLTDEKIWRMTSDDSTGSTNPDLFFIPTENILYIKVDDIGLITLIPKDQVYSVHVAFKREAYGTTTFILKKCLEWFWERSEAIELVASIPAYNYLALRLANKIGMYMTGIDKDAFIKDGFVYDIINYKIRRKQCLQ